MSTVRRHVKDLHAHCSYPLRPDAIAASDTCQKPASSAVSKLTNNSYFWYRCEEHEGLLADGSPGRINDFIYVMGAPQ